MATQIPIPYINIHTFINKYTSMHIYVTLSLSLSLYIYIYCCATCNTQGILQMARESLIYFVNHEYYTICTVIYNFLCFILTCGLYTL